MGCHLVEVAHGIQLQLPIAFPLGHFESGLVLLLETNFPGLDSQARLTIVHDVE
jgi:hypothetical protein